MLTGERPEVNAEVRARLSSYGHEDFTSYVVWACERALERGLLPHTNLGVLAREDLARLREVTASQGLMLESVSERLMQTVHAGSPTKHPARRLETIAAAGELKIPFTSGILVGIGEDEEERMASLEALAALHARHGHIQEVILQNFVPHQRYYGEEPAEIADAAAQRVLAHGRRRRTARAASARVGLSGRHRGHEAADRRGAAADARRRHPDPAEPRRLVGRAGRRGGDRPRRPVGQRRSHLPGAPVPLAAPGAKASCSATATRSPSGSASIPSTSTRSGSRRACSTRSRRATGRSSRAAARAAPSRPRRSRRASSPARSKRARDGRAADAAGADGDVRRDASGGDRGDAPGGRRAARRAGRRDGHLRRQPQHQHLQRLHGRAAPSAASARASARPTPTSTTSEDFVGRIHEALDFGATEICIQSGIHPDWPLEDYLGWLRLAKDTARAAGRRSCTCTPTRPMEIAHMCDISGLPPAEVFARLRDAGLDSTPGHGRRGAARRRARADLAEQAARRALGRDHRGLATRPGCARPRP